MVYADMAKEGGRGCVLFLLLVDSPQDADFLSDLYQAYYRLLYGQALSVLRNAQDAEDAVSTAMIQLTRKIDVLRSLPRNKLEAYLVITVKNTAINAYRQRKRRVARSAGTVEDLQVSDPGTSPEHQVFSSLGVERVKNAIRALPQREQQALMMRYFQQLTDNEIARDLGLKPVSVRALISRGRSRLAEILMQGGNADG
jgi:RNA polymerase sigma factor (sigma-70 family)